MSTKNGPGRVGRNPRTGEPIQIKAKTVVKFRVAKAAKDAIASKKVRSIFRNCKRPAAELAFSFRYASVFPRNRFSYSFFNCCAVVHLSADRFKPGLSKHRKGET